MSHQNTFVGGTCAPPSALLVVFTFRMSKPSRSTRQLTGSNPNNSLSSPLFLLFLWHWIALSLSMQIHH